MKRSLLVFAILLFFLGSAFAQKQKVTGVVKDAFLGETLVGANVVVKGTGTGSVTDIDGNFSLELEKGSYTIEASYVGCKSVSKNITVADKTVNLEFNLETITLEEISIVGDVARSRETPVAFTTVLPQQIEERISGQDIPMILNQTPGVYATEQGGGDGDARITIRGFSQRNVAVMLDGIPVNDMENGWVYWSNWFGLDAVTRSIQVQRGLGRSKLALPSVGGTINILTKGIESQKSLSIEQALDNNGKSTTSLGYTSGLLKNGWSFTLASSYKQGKGWVDESSVKAFFLFFKVDKRWGNHITSFTAYGAPQEHTQRYYKRAIATYDTTYASEHGVPSDDFPVINNQGIAYNYQWGYLTRNADSWNSDSSARIINDGAKREALNERVNMYFKPMFSIRDTWNVNKKLIISNILYMSLGNGGGVQTRHSLKNTNLITPEDVIQNPDLYTEDEIGQIDWQSIYKQNSGPTNTGFGEHYPIDTAFSDKLYYSTNYLVENKNNHRWIGLLTTFGYEINDNLNLSAGIDLRNYKAEHYSEVYDLLGGDYAIDGGMKFVGDKVNFNYNGLMNWGGVFGLLEYRKNNLTLFLNLTSSVNSFKKVDLYNNVESDWKYVPGYTAKLGANYNLSEHSNVFANVGYLSKTRDYKYYFQGYTTNFLPDSITKNELVKAVEVGYSYNSRRFTANINAYYTRWENKPTNQVRGQYEDPQTGVEGYTYGDIPGMDAIHTGVEVDFIYKILNNLDFQGLVSLGDWIWDKKITDLQMYFTDNNQPANKISFDATGIHVGDAAQTQLGASLRYEPVRNVYLEGNITYFDKYYSNFQPEDCTDELGNPVDSWIIPAYSMVNFHAGYRFRINKLDKLGFSLRVNVLNVLNTVYISDATNNDSYIQNPYNTFDARSASVFMGAPRQFTASLKVTIF